MLPISQNYAQDRLEAMKTCLATLPSSIIRSSSFPTPHLPWTGKYSVLQTGSITLATHLQKDSEKPGQFYHYLSFHYKPDQNLPLKGHFNIARQCQQQDGRLVIYHNGDNSTPQRKGTYNSTSRGQIADQIASQYPFLAQGTNVDSAWLRLGDIPATGPIDPTDFTANMVPGIVAHVLCRYAVTML